MGHLLIINSNAQSKVLKDNNNLSFVHFSLLFNLSFAFHILTAVSGNRWKPCGLSGVKKQNNSTFRFHLWLLYTVAQWLRSCVDEEKKGNTKFIFTSRQIMHFFWERYKLLTTGQTGLKLFIQPSYCTTSDSNCGYILRADKRYIFNLTRASELNSSSVWNKKRKKSTFWRIKCPITSLFLQERAQKKKKGIKRKFERKEKKGGKQKERKKE